MGSRFPRVEIVLTDVIQAATQQTADDLSDACRIAKIAGLEKNLAI